MDKILNTYILLNPLNWVVVFVIFTMWAFFAHTITNSTTK